MMYIFKVFDPIDLAFGVNSDSRYSGKSFDYVMENYDNYVKGLSEKLKF